MNFNDNINDSNRSIATINVLNNNNNNNNNNKMKTCMKKKWYGSLNNKKLKRIEIN